MRGHSSGFKPVRGQRTPIKRQVLRLRAASKEKVKKEKVKIQEEKARK